jgi:5'-3' exonuclease
MAMLRGDPSDGLPGVPGIGAKTAATLVGRFGSWAELRAAVDDRTDTRISPPLRAKLAAAAPYLAVVEPVVRVALDAPVRASGPDTVPAAPVDPGRLAELGARWALGGTVERLTAALAAAGTPRR